MRSRYTSKIKQNVAFSSKLNIYYNRLFNIKSRYSKHFSHFPVINNNIMPRMPWFDDTNYDALDEIEFGPNADLIYFQYLVHLVIQ